MLLCVDLLGFNENVKLEVGCNLKACMHVLLIVGLYSEPILTKRAFEQVRDLTREKRALINVRRALRKLPLSLVINMGNSSPKKIYSNVLASY